MKKFSTLRFIRIIHTSDYYYYLFLFTFLSLHNTNTKSYLLLNNTNLMTVSKRSISIITNINYDYYCCCTYLEIKIFKSSIAINVYETAVCIIVIHHLYIIVVFLIHEYFECLIITYLQIMFEDCYHIVHNKFHR